MEHKMGVIRTLTHRADTIYHNLRPTRQRTRNKTLEEGIKRCGILQVGLVGSGEVEDETRPRNTDSDSAKGQMTLPYIGGVTEPISHLIRKTGVAAYAKPHITIRSIVVAPKDKDHP